MMSEVNLNEAIIILKKTIDNELYTPETIYSRDYPPPCTYMHDSLWYTGMCA